MDLDCLLNRGAGTGRERDDVRFGGTYLIIIRYVILYLKAGKGGDTISSMCGLQCVTFGG